MVSKEKSLKMLVLAQNLHTAGGYSVGRNVTAVLPKVAPQHEYLMVIPDKVGYVEHEGVSNVRLLKVKRMSFFERIHFDFITLPKVAKEYKPDFIWGLGNSGLAHPQCKQAFLFHRPTLIYPAKYCEGMMAGEYFVDWLVKGQVKLCLRYTDWVFCQTPVMRERFARFFGYPIDKISLMPNAVSEFAKIPREQVEVPEPLREKGFFNLFFLSKFYGYKNPEILIDLFRTYPEQLRNVRCFVTIAPDQHARAPKVLEDIRRYSLEKHIVNVGPLKQDQLAGYYYSCDALLLPTRVESFSGTYVEAMFFGVPILTSDIDFARYVCEDAALYFDFWNLKDVMEKICDLRDNPELRRVLADNGRRRVSAFFKTWESIVTDAVRDIERLF